MEKIDRERRKDPNFGKKKDSDKDGFIKEDALKRLRQKLPSSLDGILNLEQHWNEEIDEYEKANSNFWMYHL